MRINIAIKWKNTGEEWKDAKVFDVQDIINKPRNHAMALFGRSIPFVIKQGADIVISNDKELRHQYHRKRFRVFTLDEIERSEELLSKVGFV